MLFAEHCRGRPATLGLDGEETAMSNDNDRIGLSGSTPEGQEVRLAGGISGQTGWRRTAAKTFAFVWLGAIGVVIIIVVVNMLG